MRYLKITLAYDGSNFVGWQVQKNGLSIQQLLESAWKNVTGEALRITASGRTDAGVHALGQVCSLATSSGLDTTALHRALNAHTPQEVAILEVVEAPENFHAIRDAKQKTYRYVIQYGRIPNVFQRNYCWFIPQSLDVASMADASTRLVGQHDFTSFEAAGGDRATSNRNVSQLTVTHRTVEHFFDNIEIEITADGFLYNMVRNIVGTLVEVGLGKRHADWVDSVLSAKDRSKAGITAPARGLFLVSVRYD